MGGRWRAVLVLASVGLGHAALGDSRTPQGDLDEAHLVASVPVQAARREDDELFTHMLLVALGDSPTMRQVLGDIASETDAENAVTVILGRDLPGVLIDSFSRNLLDLEDLERLPSAHDPDLDKNAITREEQLVHILAERRHTTKLAARLRETHRSLTREQLFAVSHEVGLLQENNYRAERHQVAVIEATSHAVKDAPGEAVIEYTLADHTTCYVVTSHHGQIDRIVPPLPPGQ
jgi:hypothetical protein